MSQIFSISNYYFNIHAIPFLISGILIIAEAVFIFLQNKRSILNISFAGIALFSGIWLTGVGIIYSCLHEPLAVFWSRYYDWFGIIFITPSVYLFSCVWGRELTRKQIRFAYLNFIAAIGVYIFNVTTTLLIPGVWSYSRGFYPRGSMIGEGIFVVWFYALMVLSFRNFIRCYRVETVAVKKKQIKLVIIAFVFGFIGSLDFIANFGIPLYTIGSGAIFMFLTMIAYTIVNYKLMDIETVLHKTILWILSFSFITIPIFLLYRLFFPVMRESIALQFTFWAVSFLALALYLRLIQPRIDHFFQRRKANLEEISSRFIEDLVHLKGFKNLIRRIEETIVDTLYPQTTDIFIYNEKKKEYVLANPGEGKKSATILGKGDGFLKWLDRNNRIVYREYVETDPAYTAIREAAREYFDSTGAWVVIPLVLNENLLGVINLGKKENLRRYSAVDFHFLATLKNQSAIAISNSLIYQNIEEEVSQRTKELVEVQKQLIQAEKLATVGTLSGGVAHEINNPLTTILTNIQMLLAFSDDNGGDMDRESLELIEQATQRCRTIVQKLMTYAKKPLETAEHSEIDLSRILERAVSFIRYQLEQDNIKIIATVEKGIYPVMGNQNELEQVLTNVILNARDAIIKVKKGGDIHISLSQKDGQLKIKIQDEGAGIKKEIVRKVFDPFFTTKDVGEGLGLGLSICQSIIEKHQGRITVHSEPDKGSVFTIQLPRYSRGDQGRFVNRPYVKHAPVG